MTPPRRWDLFGLLLPVVAGLGLYVLVGVAGLGWRWTWYGAAGSVAVAFWYDIKGHTLFK